MQFLLGVDAPVSLLLVRQILATTLLNAIIAAPLYALVRRLLAPLLPEDPRRRAAPRLHDRRPVAALARVTARHCSTVVTGVPEREGSR